VKQVIFYTRNKDEEVEAGRVWNERGELHGTVQENFLRDLQDWLVKSGEGIEEYLGNLHSRFDGTFLYAGPYREEES
jgi:hypothetical protein